MCPAGQVVSPIRVVRCIEGRIYRPSPWRGHEHPNAAHHSDVPAPSPESSRLRTGVGRVRSWLAADWRGARYAPFGGALLLLATFVTVAYYANRPDLQLDPDTAAYVIDAHRIGSGGGLVDPARLPGYPLLALLRWGLLAWRRTRDAFTVQMMSAVALLAFYGLVLTSLGGTSTIRACGRPMLRS